MSTVRLLVGDVFDRMTEIPDGSVDLIVTSPPFLALRSYLPADHPDKAKEIGSEPTPAAYLATLLALTREWRRILAPHGSICVELGDTYSGGGGGGDYNQGGLQDGQQAFDGSASRNRQRGADDSVVGRDNDGAAVGAGSNARFRKGYVVKHPDGRVQSPKADDYDVQYQPADVKGGRGWPLPKSLCGTPTLYAWSLAYGHNLLDPDDRIDPWRVRNLIVWHRPNPPVGQLFDKVRPSTSYITVACVSDKRWFDLDSERTDTGNYRDDRGTTNGRVKDKRDGGGSHHGTMKQVVNQNPAGAPPLDCWIDGDVWTIPTAPYKGAHYATYPPALPRRLINLMCPRQVCVVCGEPRRRITRQTDDYAAARSAINAGDPASISGRSDSVIQGGPFGHGGGAASLISNGKVDTASVTLGWTDCGHDTWRRGHVLDPFAGSGTTGAAAAESGRDCTLIDIDDRNTWLIRERVGLFLDDVT